MNNSKAPLEKLSRYANSIAQLNKAEELIPLGAQTVSKSRLTFNPGTMPLYATSADGCRITDVDGNVYVDLVAGLAAVNLGYNDSEINEAVTRQLPHGVTISLAHPIEEQVASLIVDLVPSAEMVRFGKNGSDATSAAIRVARAYTGRDDVIVCGYHGWHDWYIGTLPTRSLGVPTQFSDLAHPVPYNDLVALEQQLKSKPTAAVIMEPMGGTWPNPGYLEGVRKLCDRYHSLLIFDEMVTGFRFANGGAQEFFGVVPDISTFGKGMANGFPLSAIAGKRKYMEVLEEVFFSGTFGGELLSLTAAKVVLTRIRDTKVIDSISDIGEELTELVEREIANSGASELINLGGHPAWKFINIDSQASEAIQGLKTLFLQEMAKNGVLAIASHNIMASHDKDAVSQIVDAYKASLPVVLSAVNSGEAISLLDAPLIAAGKTVRS